MALLNKPLRREFGKLGVIVARRPSWFIFTSLAIIILCSVGFMRLTFENDLDYLFIPTSGESWKEKAVVNASFPVRYNGRYEPSREVELGRFARIIVESKTENSNILRTSVFEEIKKIDDAIHSVTVPGGQNYSSLCAKWGNKCYENDILELLSIMKEIEVGNLTLSYPFMLNPVTFSFHSLAHNLFGVEFQDAESKSVVKSAKAIILHYHIDLDNSINESGKDLSIEWERNVVKKLKELENSWKEVREFRFTQDTVSEEHIRTITSAIPKLGVTVFLAGTFTVIALMMKDWVLAKPLEGLVGLAIPPLACLCGFGLVNFAGIPTIALLASVPFITLGIGLDDTFVMVAAWRRTDPKSSVEKRLSECYSEASVSITITTLTDVMSFAAGVMTPIRSVQIFSIYAASSVICTYVLHLTLFGAVLAISGYYEQKKRHSLFRWMEVIPKSKAEKSSLFVRLMLAGGNEDEENKENAVMAFFRDQFSSFLSWIPTRIFVIGAFLSYLAVSSYGLTNLKEGLELENIFMYDSYMRNYLQKENEYFRPSYSFRMNVVVNQPLDYSDVSTQRNIDYILGNLTVVPKITAKYKENWLSDFVHWVDARKELFDFDISSEEKFIDVLKNDYNLDSRIASLDVAFDKNKTEIIASRYMIQMYNISSDNDIVDCVIKLRNVAKSFQQSMGIRVSVFNSRMAFVDQYVQIKSISLNLLCFAALAVFIVALVFIPNLKSSVLVLFTIVSIEFGVVGFMSFMDVRLDIISLIGLVMCTGFSVDYVAHLSYSLIATAKDEVNPTDKLRSALHAIGFPLVQSALSTLLSVVALPFVGSYSHAVMFFIILVVISFSLLHALFLLPISYLIISDINNFIKNFGKKKNFQSVQALSFNPKSSEFTYK